MVERATGLVGFLVVAGRLLFSSSCARRRWRAVGDCFLLLLEFVHEVENQCSNYNVNTRLKRAYSGSGGSRSGGGGSSSGSSGSSAAAAALWAESYFFFVFVEIIASRCRQSHPVPTMLLWPCPSLLGGTWTGCAAERGEPRGCTPQPRPVVSERDQLLPTPNCSIGTRSTADASCSR